MKHQIWIPSYKIANNLDEIRVTAVLLWRFNLDEQFDITLLSHALLISSNRLNKTIALEVLRLTKKFGCWNKTKTTTTIKKLWSDGSHICIHWVEQKSWYCFLSLLWLSMFWRRFLDMHLFLYWWCSSFFSRLLAVVIARNGRITHPQTPIQPHLLHLIKTNYCLHTMLYISSLKKIYCLFGIYYARNVSVAFLQIKIWTDLWAHSLVSVVFFRSLHRASVFHIVSLILSRNRLTFHLCSK